MEEIRLGKYKHFKGTLVEVIGLAYDSETLERVVVYLHPDPVKGLGENTMWVRSLDMFTETIERDGKTIKRFEYIGE
jgi:hypothetical protein